MDHSCANCSSDFEISPEEKILHDKICGTFETGPAPTPTLCSSCRMIKMMVWRNERFLYNRKCDKTGKDVIAVYPTDAPFPVYERHEWWSDNWDPLEYGREYDFNRPFFDQYAELLHLVPRPALNTQNVENCDYCNFAFDSRNCYLCICTYSCESLLYCYWSLNSKDCTDCAYCFESEQCLWCTDCNHAFNCVSCNLSHNCTDCFYLYDCRGCQNCFGCVGLRQKQYQMFNEQLSKEEYEQRILNFDLQNPTHVQAVEDRVHKLKMGHPHLYSIQEKNEDCTGDYIFESKDCTNCYQTYRSRDCINVNDTETTDCLDSYHIGWSQATYGSYSDVRQQNSAFNIQCWDGSENYYDDNCQFSSHCFGSIGLRHQEYCILNKKYSKEEYLELLPKIVDHMKSTGEWGQFFPTTLSPFAYNETMAQEYFPSTKEEIEKKGWRWKDQLPYTKGKETITWDQVPQRIEDVPSSIVDEVLACEATGRNFRIAKQELEFYRNKKLPIPRLHPDERHKRRLALRNPRKLWDRKCGKCSKEIQTTYAPERPETVYCEECYLKEVY